MSRIFAPPSQRHAGVDPINGPHTAVGFDLDMTLIDSRPASGTALRKLGCTHLAVQELMDQYGLPIDRWLPDDIPPSAFREEQLKAVDLVAPMPGAPALLSDLRAAGLRVVVITASTETVAREMLAVTALPYDALHSDAWADGKTAWLRREACQVFVGDPPEAMQAARAADAIGLGVRTGLYEPRNADIAFDTLVNLRAWWQQRSRAGHHPGGESPLGTNHVTNPLPGASSC